MKSLFLLALIFLFISCSDKGSDITSTEYPATNENLSDSTETIFSNPVTFLDKINLSGYSSITAYVYPVINLKPVSEGSKSGWVTDGFIDAASFRVNGTTGKTYTEEFEDKQGKLRTKVYENGLLVSYKINGVEQ